MSDPNPLNFGQNAREALRDETLRGALRRATGLFSERRALAIAQVDDWDTLRERGRAIREEVLLHLDTYLEQFEENATRQGMQVHWARNGEEACRLVVDIALEAGASTAVKGKSMTTEEIHLNAALDRAGVEAIETDLGEWIVQLAGERPSHIIVPAIHKTKAQVQELFADKVGLSPDSDIEQLTQCARSYLRERFVEAGLGVTGANFAVAETGSVFLVENEGNIRLATSLPRVHVAILGIEKLVPTLQDLAVFFRLLPRSGTGQQLTTYQSILSGPRRDSEPEGPEAVHVVLLDNGRSALLSDPLTRSSLHCIRCGACLNACPVYQQVGGHAYGSVYSGPIGAVITPQLQGIGEAAPLPYASSLCGACRDVCPVGIDLPALLLRLRSRIAEGTDEADQKLPAGRPRWERLAVGLWAWSWSAPWRYRVTGWLLRLFLRMGRPLPVPPLRAWTQGRDLGPIRGPDFRTLWKAGLDREQGDEPEDRHASV